MLGQLFHKKRDKSKSEDKDKRSRHSKRDEKKFSWKSPHKGPRGINDHRMGIEVSPFVERPHKLSRKQRNEEVKRAPNRLFANDENFDPKDSAALEQDEEEWTLENVCESTDEYQEDGLTLFWDERHNSSSSSTGLDESNNSIKSHCDENVNVTLDPIAVNHDKDASTDLYVSEYGKAKDEAESAVDAAMDALEDSVKLAQHGIEQARKDKASADDQFELFCQEESEAREIYEASDGDAFVKSKLKDYHDMAMGRKNQAAEKQEEARMAVERARQSFVSALKKSLGDLENAEASRDDARLKLESPVQMKPETEKAPLQLKDTVAEKQGAATALGESDIVSPDQSRTTCHPTSISDFDTRSNSSLENHHEEQPHHMFGTFDTEEYLRRMEMSCPGFDSEDEIVSHSYSEEGKDETVLLDRFENDRLLEMSTDEALKYLKNMEKDISRSPGSPETIEEVNLLSRFENDSLLQMNMEEARAYLKSMEKEIKQSPVSETKKEKKVKLLKKFESETLLGMPVEDEDSQLSASTEGNDSFYSILDASTTGNMTATGENDRVQTPGQTPGTNATFYSALTNNGDVPGFVGRDQREATPGLDFSDMNDSVPEADVADVARYTSDDESNVESDSTVCSESSREKEEMNLMKQFESDHLLQMGVDEALEYLKNVERVMTETVAPPTFKSTNALDKRGKVMLKKANRKKAVNVLAEVPKKSVRKNDEEATQSTESSDSPLAEGEAGLVKQFESDGLLNMSTEEALEYLKNTERDLLQCNPPTEAKGQTITTASARIADEESRHGVPGGNFQVEVAKDRDKEAERLSSQNDSPVGGEEAKLLIQFESDGLLNMSTDQALHYLRNTERHLAQSSPSKDSKTQSVRQELARLTEDKASRRGESDGEDMAEMDERRTVSSASSTDSPLGEEEAVLLQQFQSDGLLNMTTNDALHYLKKNELDLAQFSPTVKNAPTKWEEPPMIGEKKTSRRGVAKHKAAAKSLINEEDDEAALSPVSIDSPLGEQEAALLKQFESDGLLSMNTNDALQYLKSTERHLMHCSRPTEVKAQTTCEEPAMIRNEEKNRRGDAAVNGEVGAQASTEWSESVRGEHEAALLKRFEHDGLMKMSTDEALEYLKKSVHASTHCNVSKEAEVQVESDELERNSPEDTKATEVAATQGDNTAAPVYSTGANSEQEAKGDVLVEKASVTGSGNSVPRDVDDEAGTTDVVTVVTEEIVAEEDVKVIINATQGEDNVRTQAEAMHLIDEFECKKLLETQKAVEMPSVEETKECSNDLARDESQRTGTREEERKLLVVPEGESSDVVGGEEAIVENELLEVTEGDKPPEIVKEKGAVMSMKRELPQRTVSADEDDHDEIDLVDQLFANDRLLDMPLEEAKTYLESLGISIDVPTNDSYGIPTTMSIISEGSDEDSHQSSVLDVSSDVSRPTDSRLDSFIKTFEGHCHRVYAVATFFDDHFISGSDDGEIRAWRLSSGLCTRTFSGHSASVQSVALFDDETFLSGSDDRKIKLWDFATGECMRTFEGHSDVVSSIAVIGSDDGKRFISGSHDATIRLWDVSTADCIKEFTCQSRVHAVASLGNRRFVSGSADNTIRVWCLSTGKCVREFENASAFSISVIDEERFLAGSLDTNINLWDTSVGESVVTFEGHLGGVWSVAVIDADRFVSGSSDGTTKVWDISSARCTQTLEGHSGVVTAVDAIGGKIISSGSLDGSISLWRAG